MNKINENKIEPLIRFPEFKNKENWELMQITDILNSERSTLALNRLDLKKNGYAIYGADSVVGYIDKFQQRDPYISIVKDGSGVGRLNLCAGQTSILGTLACLKSKDEKKYKLVWTFYLLNTIDFSSYVKGAGIPHIYFSDFKYINIGVPKPKEQQKITDCLSSLDELIAAEGENLEAFRIYKKGLMQQLFPAEGESVPRLRFEIFRGSDEWVKISLGEIGDPLMCKRIFKEETTTNPRNGIPFYKIGTFGHLADSYISNAFFEEYKSKYPFPQKGDILISASGTIGRLVKFDGIPAYFQDSNIIWLGHKEELVLNDFLLYCYSILRWQTSDGGAIRRLYNSDFKGMTIYYPNDKKEQQKIAACLSSLDELISAQGKKVEALKKHKKGLMQQLFPSIDDLNE
jgi:type I restriction enzyme, S subunit